MLVKPDFQPSCTTAFWYLILPMVEVYTLFSCQSGWHDEGIQDKPEIKKQLLDNFLPPSAMYYIYSFSLNISDQTLLVAIRDRHDEVLQLYTKATRIADNRNKNLHGCRHQGPIEGAALILHGKCGRSWLRKIVIWMLMGKVENAQRQRAIGAAARLLPCMPWHQTTFSYTTPIYTYIPPINGFRSTH